MLEQDLTYLKTFNNFSVPCGGVRGHVVMAVDFESLVPHSCGFVSRQGLDSFIYEEAIQLAYETSVVLPRYPIATEIVNESGT